MLPIQSGYLSYQLGPRTQRQRAEQVEKVCHFDKIDKVQLLIIMENLNDEDRVSFIMSCKKTYKVYKEAVINKPALKPRLLLLAIRERNIAYTSIEKFKKLDTTRQLLFTGIVGCADLSLIFACASTGCCCCTLSTPIYLGLQYTAGVACGLSVLQTCGYSILSLCCLRDKEKLIKVYNNKDEKVHLIKTEKGIESQIQSIKMQDIQTPHWDEARIGSDIVWN